MVARGRARTCGLVAALAILAALVATALAASGPSAPTGLTATSPTNAAPALRWNASTGASGGYRVYRGGKEIGRTTATTYTDPSLTASGSYAYTVKAVGSGGRLSAASAPF